MKILCSILVILYGSSTAAVPSDHFDDGVDTMPRSLNARSVVTRLRLIDANTDTVIPGFDPLPNPALINLDLISTTNLNIEAITTNDKVSNKLLWNFLGVNYVETKARWAFCGNNGNDFSSCPQLKDGVNDTMTVTPTDAQGIPGTPFSTRIVIFRTPPVSSSCQVNLTLINTVTNTDSGPLSNGMVIDLSVTPSINIRADVSPTVVVGGVQFDFDGQFFRNETKAPYAFNGNLGTKYFPWTPPLGEHVITAIVLGQSGTKLCRVVVKVLVVNGSPSRAPSRTPSKKPSSVPSMMPISACTEIVNYIQSVTYSGQPLSLTGTTQEDYAVQWLCNEDKLVLDLSLASDRKRLVQRFVWLCFFRLTNRMSGLSHECDWGFADCDVTKTILEIDNITDGQVYLIAGTIPPDMALLTSLTHMFFAGSSLISGTIPASLGKLVQLIELHLKINDLTGTIPSALGSLTNMLDLDLSANHLTGTIPSSLGNMKKLKYITMNNNQLQGSFPAESVLWKQLKQVNVRTTNLQGTVPSDLCGRIPQPKVSVDCNKVTCACCGCQD